MTLNMGPQHPSTHGVLRLQLELDGETIVSCRPDIGYLHTGIEKEFEQKTYQQAVTLTDRIDYLAPLSNNLCYCLAAEKLLGLEIPPKAQWTRVMLTELTRLNSHLVWLGTHAIDIGAMSVFLYCFREREDILRIFEMFSGQRMMTSYFRVGGLALDHPRGWYERVKKFIDVFPSRVDEYEDLLTNNPIWMRAHEGRRLHFARRHAGPGRDRSHDSRRRHEVGYPQGAALHQLREVRFRSAHAHRERRVRALPGARGRDAAERAHRPAGAGRHARGTFNADAPGIVLPDREKMKTQMEALIYHFKIVTEGFRVPEGEVYQVIESPRGEVGYYMVSDGTAKPYRVHVRGPSFGNLQAVPRMVEGTLIADVIAAIGSMDFVLGDTRQVTFSPELEARFDKLMKSYPPGRQRSAMVPMLLYAQDEIGSVTQELVAEVARRLGVQPLQVEEVSSYYSMLHKQAAGKVSRADLHQYQLPAHRRRRTVGACLQETGHRPQGSDCRRADFAGRGGVHRGVFVGAGDAGELRLPSRRDAGKAGPPARQPEEDAVTDAL